MSRKVRNVTPLDEVKWVLVRFDDGELSKVEKGENVVILESGETFQDADAEIGSNCMAPWKGQQYEGKLLNISIHKDEVMKERERLIKQTKKRKATDTTETSKRSKNDAKASKKSVASAQRSASLEMLEHFQAAFPQTAPVTQLQTTPRPPQTVQKTTPQPPQTFQQPTPQPPQTFQQTTPQPPQTFQHTMPQPPQTFQQTTPQPPQTFQQTTPTLTAPRQRKPTSAPSSRATPPQSTATNPRPTPAPRAKTSTPVQDHVQNYPQSTPIYQQSFTELLNATEDHHWNPELPARRTLAFSSEVPYYDDAVNLPEDHEYDGADNFHREPSYVADKTPQENDCENCDYWKKKYEEAIRGRTMPLPTPAVAAYLRQLSQFTTSDESLEVEKGDFPCTPGKTRLLRDEPLEVSVIELRKAKAASNHNGVLMMRRLMQIVFTKEEMANSSGQGLRKCANMLPPLDPVKCRIIKDYVDAYSRVEITDKTKNKVITDCVSQARHSIKHSM